MNKKNRFISLMVVLALLTIIMMPSATVHASASGIFIRVNCEIHPHRFNQT